MEDNKERIGKVRKGRNIVLAWTVFLILYFHYLLEQLIGGDLRKQVEIWVTGLACLQKFEVVFSWYDASFNGCVVFHNIPPLDLELMKEILVEYLWNSLLDTYKFSKSFTIQFELVAS